MTCNASAVPTLVRTEGVAERIGDILLQCSGGAAGTAVTGNLNLFLPVSITNRINADSVASDVALTIEPASTSPTLPSGIVANQGISFNGIRFTIPATGPVSLRISNLRANISQLGIDSQQPVQAFIATNLSSTALGNNPVSAARPFRGLYATQSVGGIACTGSPLPAETSLTRFFAAGTRFASTRLTEGFAEAFAPKDAVTDTGTRFMVRYTGVPAGVRLFVPDVIAGSSAVQPTAGGDLGTPQGAGQYAPGGHSLLLVRVVAPNADGSGGNPVYRPGAPGSGTVTFDTAAELSVSGGTGFVVYEVMDASPVLRESAQFPTFVGVPGNVTEAAIIRETVTLAPVSAAGAASTTAPVPRFAAVEPPSDCPTLGDCDSSFFPRLSVGAQPLQFTAVAGGLALGRPGYIAVNNKSGGLMNWTATISYKSGDGWLTLDNASGINNRSVQVYANAQKLAAGTYEATVTIDAGPLAGSASVPVTFVVTALPPAGKPPEPPATPAPKATVTAFTNAADFLFRPVAPGSLATIQGTNLAGQSVSVTFDGIAARLLYISAGQINLQVPAALGAKTSAVMVVTVDGVGSAAQSVTLAPVAPAVFANGILNQDNTVNAPGRAAAPGSIIQIFATGLPDSGAGVSVKIHDRDGLAPVYAGGAPGIDGVQQVNVAVPDDLPAMTTDVLLCASGVCSHPAKLTLGR